MRATDIIRNILCLIDEIDQKPQQPEQVEIHAVKISNETDNVVKTQDNEEQRRFKQIFDLLSSEKQQQYANSPAEVVAGIDSVTKDAGGGWNGPKHPSDIRVKDPSAYPNQQRY